MFARFGTHFKIHAPGRFTQDKNMFDESVTRAAAEATGRMPATSSAKPEVP